MTFRSYVVAASLGITFAGACLESGSALDQGTRVVPTQLPALTTRADCQDGALSPTARDWAAMSRVFAVGMVVEMRPASGPWASVHGGEPIEACTDPAMLGIDLVLEDVQATLPDFAHEIVVRVTAHELAVWAVQPSVSEDVVEWRDEAGTTGVGYGMQVGGFLVDSPEAGTFLSIGPLTWIAEDGTLRFQRGPYHDECPNALPSDVEFRTFAAVAGALRGAHPETGVDRSFADFLWARSSLCTESTAAVPCVEFESSGTECPDGLACDEATMTCR